MQLPYSVQFVDTSFSKEDCKRNDKTESRPCGVKLQVRLRWFDLDQRARRRAAGLLAGSCKESMVRLRCLTKGIDLALA